MIQNPIDAFNAEHPTPDNKELEELREREHTRWQLKSVTVRLVEFFIRVGVAYWIFSLAFVGATEMVRLDYYLFSLAPEFVWVLSMLWLVFEVVVTPIYDPIRENAYEGFEILGGKLKCAIKGWRECKVGEQ